MQYLIAVLLLASPYSVTREGALPTVGKFHKCMQFVGQENCCVYRNGPRVMQVCEKVHSLWYLKADYNFDDHINAKIAEYKRKAPANAPQIDIR